MEILCFVAGMLFYYKHNIYLYFFLLASVLFRPKITFILAFIFALIWGALHTILVQPKIISDNLYGKTLLIKGKIVSLPKANSTKTQFVLKPDVYSPILVNCYKNCSNVEINQYVIAKLKLRKPRNYLNPGGFDYVDFLNARHIFWLASSNSITILDTNTDLKNISVIRSKLKSNLENTHISQRSLAIVQALTIGFSSNLTENDWKLFRRTGTIHLLVISGAHIGFVAGFVFLLINFLWSRSSDLCLIMPSVNVASICAILVACSYSLLAGFSVSVQRAFIGCLLVFGRNFFKRKFISWQVWRIAIFTCVIYEPHYVLFPGFYLSFIAVAILYVVGSYFKVNKFYKTIILQLSCLIGLLPFTLYWFSYASINGFFANLVAIPLVGFIIVPLSLIFLISTIFFNSILFGNFVSSIIDLLFWYLHLIDNYLNFNLEFSISLYGVLCFVLMIFIGLVYPVKSLRLVFLFLLCVFILPKSHRVRNNEARIDVLDVGQGLAVFIRTHKHALIYDTGGKFYHGKDLAELVISPYLKSLNIKSIDMLIVSHPDLDHRGGLPTLEKDFKVQKLVVNNPKYYKRGENCHTLKQWTWDGVEFKFLPISTNYRKRNNDSCVLLIKTMAKSILLPGDLERDAERFLVNKYSHTLKADYLIVPHHGSKTSSSLEFLQMVSPKYAIFSYGYNNRYHFPDSTVVARYNNLHIKTFNTADGGMITIN